MPKFAGERCSPHWLPLYAPEEGATGADAAKGADAALHRRHAYACAQVLHCRWCHLLATQLAGGGTGAAASKPGHASGRRDPPRGD